MTKQFAPQPTKSKRRKSAAPKPQIREPTPDEVLYEIRDIIDEKVVKGKLLYKVDWADNPTTGEQYDPTWEPAKNVTEAAVDDWESEKRRRRPVGTESSHPSAESDSQPVLPPNSRAKRRRELSPTAEGEEEEQEEEGRAPKRPRRSIDSGYTSTDGDVESSWAHVHSTPENKDTKIVLDITRRPGFDPSEYRLITSSQSAASSQTAESAILQGNNSQRAFGQISQRTIPDSQDGFDSLRTQSTAQSAAVVESQVNRSELDIPSRQPDSLHHGPGHASDLLETHQSVQATFCESPNVIEGQLAGQEFPSEDNPWGGGFLTQPEFRFPSLTETEVASSQTGQVISGNPSLEQDQEEHQLNDQGNSAGRYPFLSPSETHPNLQAAQEVPQLDTHLGLLTQVSEGIGQSSEDIVPETVRRSKRRSVTPSRNMESQAESTPRLSAAEMMRQLHAQVFGESADPPPAENKPGPAPTLVSPSAVFPPMENFAEHLEASAVPESSSAELDQRAAVDFDVSSEIPIVGGHSMEFEQPPATVAPADLTTAVEHIASVDRDDQVLDEDLEEPGPESPPAEPDQFPLHMGADEQDDHSRHFTVTLPMAANTRATYLETISENKATMIKFGEVFADSYPSVPEPSLVAKIDSIFERLLNLCDLPAYDDDLPELSKGEMMKHATNSNSKFSFVYEFLYGLWDINARILVLSKPGRVFEYLEALVSTTDCPYTVLSQGGEDLSGQPTEGTAVILAVAGQDLSKVQAVDVVIAFDHTARSVELPATLGYESMAPIVLSLVATYSLDHIDQQMIEQDLDSFERRNALNLAIDTAMEYLRNPERQYVEPHEAAKTFASFLRSPEIGLDWEPHPLPADIFEIWLSSLGSQERTQESQAPAHEGDPPNGPGGRKRPLDNVDEGTPKRLRILESQQPSRHATPARMSDLLKQTLANHAVEAITAQVVEVPVEQLERMSGKIAELEARLASQSVIEAKTREHCMSLEAQLRSYERTIQSLEPKYMDALRDRSAFEKQCKKAVERLEAQTAELEVVKQKNKLLETKLAEANDALANSSNPDVAKLATVDRLEKKILSLQNEVDYSRKAYQDASNAYTELSQANKELQTKVTELTRRASENLRMIHRIHAQNEMTDVNRQIDELEATLENRERELERAKEELKFIKNGRRETRQGSVPRSPRTSVMSPRPARGMGGGAGSRGTSPAPLMSSDGPSGGGGGGGGGAPVPGMTFFPPAGNSGRWGHLRD